MVVCCRSLPLTAHPTRACPAGCPASRGAPTLQGCQPTVPYRPRGLRRGCPHPLHDLSCKPPAAAPLALARGIRFGLRCPSAAHAPLRSDSPPHIVVCCRSYAIDRTSHPRACPAGGPNIPGYAGRRKWEWKWRGLHGQRPVHDVSRGGFLYAIHAEREIPD